MDDELLISILNLANNIIINNNKLLEVNKELIKMNTKRSKYACITIAVIIIVIAIFLLFLYKL